MLSSAPARLPRGLGLRGRLGAGEGGEPLSRVVLGAHAALQLAYLRRLALFLWLVVRVDRCCQAQGHDSLALQDTAGRRVLVDDLALGDYAALHGLDRGDKPVPSHDTHCLRAREPSYIGRNTLALNRTLRRGSRRARLFTNCALRRSGVIRRARILYFERID
jgi:hypothetical protein